MINYFETAMFSNSDYTKALELKGINGGYKKAKQVNQSVYSVQYNIYNGVKWVVGSTFVSVQTLLLAKYHNTCLRAKHVEFKENYAGVFVTNNNHCTSIDRCTCPNFTGKFTTKFQLRINGKLVCKHQIALAKKVLQISKISDYLALRSA